MRGRGVEIEVVDDREAAARRVAELLAEAARAAQEIALTGGSTPARAYELAAELEPEWSEAGVWWGDERCVPPDDPRSNYRMAKEVLLDRVPIPPEQVHRIRGEEEPEKAAADYELELKRVLGCHPERSEGAALRMTGIDLVLLGMGEDGHTASLFPGQPSVHETQRWAIAVLAPDRKLWRVTLTTAILNLASNVTFVVSGANKAQTLQRVLEQPSNPDALPAQAIRPVHGRLTWMVDEAAASGLRPARASR